MLVDLSASARELERFLDDSAEFAEVARPVDPRARRDRRGGPPGGAGRAPARARAAPVRAAARSTSRPNLRIMLEDFADPARAVERDPRSPGGKGYSGAQALLRYVFSQSLDDQRLRRARATWCARRCTPTSARRTRTPSARRRARSRRGLPRVARARTSPASPARPDRRGGGAKRPSAARRRQQATASRRRGQRRRGRRAGSALAHAPGAAEVPPLLERPARRPARAAGRRRADRRPDPAPRLPPRPMTRRPSTSIVASPVLVGAVTVLVDRRRRLPRLQREPGPAVRADARREGARRQRGGARPRRRGARGRLPRSASCERCARARSRAAGRAPRSHVKLDGGVGDLPVDTAFTIRPRSPLGLKYLEMVRGASAETARRRPRVPGRDRRPSRCSSTTSARIYDAQTRARRCSATLWASATRSPAAARTLNQAIERAAARVRPARRRCTRNLARPRARDSAASSASSATPRASWRRWRDEQADLFTRAAVTFEAISRDAGGAQGDDLALASGAPGRHRVVPGPAPVPHRQRARSRARCSRWRATCARRCRCSTARSSAACR